MKFDSIDDLKSYVLKNSNLYCRWIKRHIENGRCVMSVHELPEEYNKEMDSSIQNLYSSINKLISLIKPVNTKHVDITGLVKEVYDRLKKI